MHIGIVAPCSSGLLGDLLPESGGVDIGCGGYLIATLVRALVDHGHRVSVVTLSAEIDAPTILQGPRLTYYVYPMRTSKRMRDLFKVERQGLRTGIDLAQPEVLHAHWTYEFALASLESGVPTVVTIHDNGFQQLRFTKDLYRLGRLYMQIQVLRKSRFLTAVSPYLTDSLRWLAKTEIKVIPNPIQVPPQESNLPFQKNGEGVKIGTVLNGWGSRKNPKRAIEAFNLFRKNEPESQMLMYGVGFEEGGPAQKWASSRGLDRNIHFRGPVPYDDLQRELRTLSILLHPAVEESFGMAVVEAMALGLPVVAGISAGGLPWVVDQGRAGFLTDVTSAREIARALLTCIRNADDREQRRKNAYQKVVSIFSPEVIAAQYERIYQQALASF